MTVATTRNAAVKKMRLEFSPLASSAMVESPNSSRPDFYKEVGLYDMISFILLKFIFFLLIFSHNFH